MTNVEAVAAKLKNAKSFADIFGTPKDAHELRRSFRTIAKAVYPDFASPDEKTLANATFHALKEVWEAADQSLKDGTYATAYSANVEYSDLQSATAIYRVPSIPYRTGDFSTLYKARRVNGTEMDVLMKIASTPQDNLRLEKEAQIWQKFATDPVLKRLAPYVPSLLDSFTIQNGRERYRALVTPFQPEPVSVTQILEAYPNGLEGPDAAWIARRVLGQAVAAFEAGYVHGAIVPDHVLVGPLSHEPLHIGWTHAVPHGPTARITQVITRWKDYYPPEVFEKKRAGHRTDVFMAAKTVVALFGGDVVKGLLPKNAPARVTAALYPCLDRSRSSRPDGATSLKRLTEAVRSVWGRQYRPLKLTLN